VANYNDACAALIAKINQMVEARKAIRKKEEELNFRGAALANQYQMGAGSGGSELEKAMNSVLPPHLRPGNVGEYSKARWGFDYVIDVDMGTNPTYTANTDQRGTLQVSQEAGLLLTHVIVDFDEPNSESGFLGPLTVEFRDLQSSRQFNDNPIPIQALGRNSRPTRLKTPMLILPNARLEARVRTFLTGAETMVTAGSGKIQFLFGGSRIRVADQQAVLSGVFDDASGYSAGGAY